MIRHVHSVGIKRKSLKIENAASQTRASLNFNQIGVFAAPETPMHNIITSAASNLIDIRLTGFASAAEVEMLETQFSQLFVVGKLRPGYLLLVDISTCAVQSQAVVSAIGQVADRMPKAQRIAVISNSAILNMQLVRILDRPYMRAVMERRAALDWLLRAEEPRQAA